MTKPAALAALAAIAALAAAPRTAGAQTVAPLGGTFEQRRACEPDAFKFCGNYIPDIPRITACMQQNVAKLTPACRAYFKEPAAQPRGKGYP